METTTWMVAAALTAASAVLLTGWCFGLALARAASRPVPAPPSVSWTAIDIKVNGDRSILTTVSRPRLLNPLADQQIDLILCRKAAETL